MHSHQALEVYSNKYGHAESAAPKNKLLWIQYLHIYFTWQAKCQCGITRPIYCFW